MNGEQYEYLNAEPFKFTINIFWSRGKHRYHF